MGGSHSTSGGLCVKIRPTSTELHFCALLLHESVPGFSHLCNPPALTFPFLPQSSDSPRICVFLFLCLLHPPQLPNTAGHEVSRGSTGFESSPAGVILGWGWGNARRCLSVGFLAREQWIQMATPSQQKCLLMSPNFFMTHFNNLRKGDDNTLYRG